MPSCLKQIHELPKPNFRCGRLRRLDSKNPYLKINGKWERVLPYKTVRKKMERKPCNRNRALRVLALMEKMGPDEFLWWKGRIYARYARTIRDNCEVVRWRQGEQEGYLLFRKGSLGKIPDGQVPVGEEGRVQKIFGLPDFSQAVPR